MAGLPLGTRPSVLLGSPISTQRLLHFTRRLWPRLLWLGPGGLLAGFLAITLASAARAETTSPAQPRLQLSVQLDTTNGLLHCRLENLSPETWFTTCSCEHRWLQIKPVFPAGNTNWVTWSEWQIPFCVYAGGPVPFHPLASHTALTNSFRDWPVRDYHDYLQMTAGDTNAAGNMVRVNEWLARRTQACRGDSFAFDLAQPHWPASLPPHTALRLRVNQTVQIRPGPDLNSASPVQELNLYSPDFHLTPAQIEAWMKLGREAFPSAP